MRRSPAARVLRSSLLGFAALCSLARALPAAEGHQLALDASATMYRLQQGTYGELFPEGTAAATGNPVLALDVIPAQGEVQRWVVPGTETWDPESSASLVYEKSSGMVYLVWQTLFNGLHPLLHLAGFDGAEWSEVTEIANGPFTNKGSPELVVIREAGPDGQDRTLLQLVWWEEAPSAATSRKRFAPILLEADNENDEVFLPPVLDLSSFLHGGGEVDSPLPDVTGLEDALTLRTGTNDHSTVIGFLDPETHRLVTLRAELLPRALSSLADEIRAHIVIVGHKTPTLGELADSARARLLEAGAQFHEATRGYLAEQVLETIGESTEELTPEGISSIAEKIRAHIVIVGSRIRIGGIDDVSDSQILEIGSSSGGESHYLDVSVVSDWPAPEVGGPARLLLSESGRGMIVTWEEDGCVHFRESSAEGWSEPGVIELSEDLDRETVLRTLQRRVSGD